MEKVTINGKEYNIDIEKCKEQGLLIEEKNYPKDWETFLSNSEISFDDIVSARALDNERRYRRYDQFNTLEEAEAFNALGKLIQLRHWWWDNMCDGWRPDSKVNYVIIRTIGDKGLPIMDTDDSWGDSYTFSFPTEEIRDKFFETYRDLIEEAKMFL